MMAAEETKTYYAWVVCQRDEFAEALAAKLIRRGFTVGPLGRQLITKHDEYSPCIIALSLYRVPKDEAERKEYSPSGLHKEIVDVIKQLKGKFWGLIVSGVAGCTWNTGNVNSKTEEKEAEEQRKKVN